MLDQLQGINEQIQGQSSSGGSSSGGSSSGSSSNPINNPLLTNADDLIIATSHAIRHDVLVYAVRGGRLGRV